METQNKGNLEKQLKQAYEGENIKEIIDLTKQCCETGEYKLAFQTGIFLTEYFKNLYGKINKQINHADTLCEPAKTLVLKTYDAILYSFEKDIERLKKET